MNNKIIKLFQDLVTQTTQTSVIVEEILTSDFWSLVLRGSTTVGGRMMLLGKWQTDRTQKVWEKEVYKNIDFILPSFKLRDNFWCKDQGEKSKAKPLQDFPQNIENL